MSTLEDSDITGSSTNVNVECISCKGDDDEDLHNHHGRPAVGSVPRNPLPLAVSDPIICRLSDVKEACSPLVYQLNSHLALFPTNYCQLHMMISSVAIA